MDIETLGYVSSPFDDFGSFSLPSPGSPQIYFSEINNFPAPPADAPGDHRPAWSTDADMSGVNVDDVAAPQAAVRSSCATCMSRTEIQHLEKEEEEDAQRLFEQCLFGEVDPLTAPDEKLVEPAPAPEDGRPAAYSAAVADMPEVNDAAPEPTSKHVKDEARLRLLGSFKKAMDKQLRAEGHTSKWRARFWEAVCSRYLEVLLNSRLQKKNSKIIMAMPLWCCCCIVVGTAVFRGPDSKGRKAQQGGWKEKSMTGMRAVADPSSPQPRPGQQEPRYVGLKKTLELDDDGKGNKWRAHEYTPLLPSDDGTNKLVPAEISLRVEFKEDDEPAPSSASSMSSKRSRNGAPKDGLKIAPKKSPVWEHMTKVHVKVATTNTDGPKRKNNPCYKVMFSICHHCDRVFNADSGHGTNNLSKHLDTCCNCNCTHSH